MDKLSAKQKKVMNELFEGKDENTVLAKNNVSRQQFSKWIISDTWRMEYEVHLQTCQRQAQTIIATFAPIAAAKLIQLTECKKEVTARQACLDIIQMERIVPEVMSVDDENLLPFSRETIAEMTEVLARDAQRKRENKSKENPGQSENTTANKQAAS